MGDREAWAFAETFRDFGVDDQCNLMNGSKVSSKRPSLSPSSTFGIPACRCMAQQADA
jgi:hypothetical protein